jgi:hypothetical protein
MHPLTQLRLDGVKRRPHPLGYSLAAYSEMALGVRRTMMREPKKCEGLRFFLAAQLPISLREPTKFDQSRLLRMEFQRPGPEL